MANRLTRWVLTLVAAAALSTFAPGEAHALRCLFGRDRQTTPQQVVYYPVPAVAPASVAAPTPVVTGYPAAAPVVRQPVQAYRYPTGTYPPYPTTPSPQYSSPRYQPRAPAVAIPAPTVSVPAAVAPTLSNPTASTLIPSQAPRQTVAYPYTPRVTYRTVWSAVPVTSYRPVTTPSGTSLQACSRLHWQARRVPQTTLRPPVVYAPQSAVTAYSIPAPPATYSSLPAAPTAMPPLSRVQPATGAINSATAYDGYGATTAWSGYSTGAAFSPPASPNATTPQSRYPQSSYPTSTTTAPQVAPPGYTYQLVPKTRLNDTTTPQAGEIPLSPVPADTRPQLENPPPKQTLMRPRVQTRRITPIPDSSASSHGDSPFDLPLGSPSTTNGSSHRQSETEGQDSSSRNPYPETQSNSPPTSKVIPAAPRLQPIPLPRSIEATAPIESAPPLIRPRSHTAASKATRYAAFPTPRSIRINDPGKPTREF